MAFNFKNSQKELVTLTIKYKTQMAKYFFLKGSYVWPYPQKQIKPVIHAYD